MARLPQQLRKQIEETNELEKAIRQEVGTKRVGESEYIRAVPDSALQPDPQEPVAAEPATPEPATPDSTGSASPAPEPPSSDAASATSPLDVAPEEGDWRALYEKEQQRYRALQGKYDAEVPRMARDLAQANDSIARLQEQIEQFSAPEESPAPEESFFTNPAAATLITPNDKEEYGEEMVDFINRASRAALEAPITQLTDQVARLQTDLATLKEQTNNVATKQVRNEISETDAYLDEHAPKWRQLNHDAQFSAWATQPDPMSGIPRSELLRAAYGSGDKQRASYIFNQYTQEDATLTQAASQNPAPAERSPAVSLDTLVTPTATTGAEHPAPAESEAPPDKRTWNSKQVAQFYQARTRGEFKGREAEAEAIERDILAAAAEGRYVA